MLTMSQINHIKDLSNCGYRISEISKKQVLIQKRYASILHRMTSHRNHPLSRRSHPNWILSNPSSRNSWTKTRSIGASSTIPLRESMSVSWEDMDIQGVTALSSAI